MASVSYANFVMMANVSPTNFFNISIGLIQGCPIAPLLFTLVIDGPSRMIEVSRKDAILSSIKFSFVLQITHLIFFMMLYYLEKDLWNNGAHFVVDVFVTSECIHLYILYFISPLCSYQKNHLYLFVL